jgi:hypothetical protein
MLVEVSQCDDGLARLIEYWHPVFLEFIDFFHLNLGTTKIAHRDWQPCRFRFVEARLNRLEGALALYVREFSVLVLHSSLVNFLS